MLDEKATKIMEGTIMNPIFIAKIKNGKIEFNNLLQFTDYLKTIEGKEVEVIVRKWKEGRSGNQNRYMWGVAYQLISDTTGYTSEEVHDAMRMMFLLDRDRKVPTLKSTASLTTVEMEKYLDSIRQWAAETMSCFIPLPNEVEL